MKITITSGKADEARDVTIEDADAAPVTFKAANLSEAHKLIKKGRTEGWDTLKAKPAKGA